MLNVFLFPLSILSTLCGKKDLNIKISPGSKKSTLPHENIDSMRIK